MPAEEGACGRGPGETVGCSRLGQGLARGNGAGRSRSGTEAPRQPQLRAAAWTVEDEVSPQDPHRPRRPPRHREGTRRAGQPSTQTEAARSRARPENNHRGIAQDAERPSLRPLTWQGYHQFRCDCDPRNPEKGGPPLPGLTQVSEALPAPQPHPLPVRPQTPHFLAIRLPTLPTSLTFSLGPLSFPGLTRSPGPAHLLCPTHVSTSPGPAPPSPPAPRSGGMRASAGSERPAPRPRPPPAGSPSPRPSVYGATMGPCFRHGGFRRPGPPLPAVALIPVRVGAPIPLPLQSINLPHTVLALPELLIRHPGLWPGSPLWSLLSHLLPHSRAIGDFGYVLSALGRAPSHQP